MVDRCFNPDCKKELHYLREGRVVRVMQGKGKELLIEHFWLCGACYQFCDFDFLPEGNVSLAPRSSVETRTPSHYRFDDLVVSLHKPAA
jgi:hypothetical protein